MKLHLDPVGIEIFHKLLTGRMYAYVQVHETSFFFSPGDFLSTSPQLFVIQELSLFLAILMPPRSPTLPLFRKYFPTMIQAAIRKARATSDLSLYTLILAAHYIVEQ